LANVDAAHGLDAAGPGSASLLNELIVALEGDIDRHFRFEEEALFPELEDAGEGDFVEALRADHVSLQAMARQIAVLAKTALADRLVGEEWRKFVQIGRVYAHELIAHTEREEMALLPMLELHLDDDKDAMLWQEYALGEELALAAEQ
jgi:hemerythrin-like domain-containing protein